MIRGLAHVCFTVSDLDRSEAFYRMLGFAHAFDFLDDSQRRFGVYLHAGDRIFLELFEGEPGPAAETQSFRHICLEVEGIADAVARVTAAGVEVTEPTLGSDRSLQAWLADPDGNRIELHQYMPDSRQALWLSK